MAFPLLNDQPCVRRAAVPAALAALSVLAAVALACGEAVPGDSLLTIAECQELGGSPLFDPEDERPVEMSCPEGLSFFGEFDEPFFGAEGGICCGGSEGGESAAVAPE